MPINLREDAPNQVADIDPQKLTTEIATLQSIQQEISNHDEKTKELKEREKYYSNIVIPDLMNEMNLSTLKLKDGSEISVKNIFGAAIIADKKESAHNWLREKGLGDIVKNEITVNFGQGEENKAAEYADLAKGHGYEPSQKEAVHAGTLRVTMEDWKNKGNDVPEDLFWKFDGSQTKIKNK